MCYLPGMGRRALGHVPGKEGKKLGDVEQSRYGRWSTSSKNLASILRLLLPF